MPVAELTAGGFSLRGRPAKPLEVEVLRELGPSDIALLGTEREVQPSVPLIAIRDRHHAIARLLAQGKKPAEVSAITGMGYSRISILRQDPMFKELVAHYQREEDSLLADFTERTGLLALTVINNLQEMAENDENPLSAAVQLEIAKFAADRTGHSPIQKNLNVNATMDLGNRLAAARARLQGIVPIEDTTVKELDLLTVIDTSGAVDGNS